MRRSLFLFTFVLATVSLSFGDESERREHESSKDRTSSLVTDGNILIRNATVIPVVGETMPETSVLVIDGRIEAIGKDIEAPEGVAVVDANGRYLTPGVIDAHSHIAIGGGINEGTMSVTPEVRIRDVIRNSDVSMYRALAGGVTSAHLMHGSANAIGGQCATIKLRYKRPIEELIFPGAPRTVKFALGENPKRSNSPTRRGERFPASRTGVEAVIRRSFTAAQDYMREWETYGRKLAQGETPIEPRRDLRLEALASVIKGDIWVQSHCYRSDEILMLMRVAEEFGFRIKTFHHVLEGYKVAPEMAKHGAMGSTFSDWWAYKFEAYHAIPYNAALMHEAGVISSVNSDSGELMRRLNLEAAKCIKYGGLNESEAMAMVTLNAAKQVGIDPWVGTIEVGKHGDLALWNGHPLSVYAKCDMTLIDGEVFFERPGCEGTPLAAPTFSDPERYTVWKGELPEAESYFIRNATIHTMVGEPIENGDLLIQGSKIAAVGQDLPVPPDAHVIEAEGRLVLPGFIDGSSTLGLSEIGSVPATEDASEIGGIQPDLRAGVCIYHDSEHIPVARVNGITSALVVPSGGSISGQSTMIDLDGWSTEMMIGKDRVALHVNLPGGGRRRRAASTADMSGRLGELKKAFEDAIAYSERQKNAYQNGDAFKRDLRMESLVPYAQGKAPVIISASRKSGIEKAIEFAEELGLDLILRGAVDGWKCADLIAEKNIPVIVGPVLTTPRSSSDPYDAAFFNVARMVEKGIKIGFQSGSSSNVRNLPYHVAMAVAHGLPWEEGLKGLTINTAEILGVNDRVGSLEKGKIANIQIVDGDPFEIRSQIVHLFIKGRPIPLESKHTRLYERYRKRLSPAVETETEAISGTPGPQ